MPDFAVDFDLPQNDDAVTKVEVSDTTAAYQSVIFVAGNLTVFMKSIFGKPNMRKRLSKITSNFEKLSRQNGQQKKAAEFFLSKCNFHYHYWFRFRKNVLN